MKIVASEQVEPSQRIGYRVALNKVLAALATRKGGG